VTVHPEWIAPAALEGIEAVAILGEAPLQSIAAVAASVGLPAPAGPTAPLAPGQALFWRPGAPEAVRFEVAGQRTQRRRHRRKYAEGELPEDRSFWFRGPQGKLRLRAQNLFVFLQMGEGVDEDTWLHHLRAHDYSRWMREFIKDPHLGDEVASIERDAGLSAEESRRRVREAVERHYTLPAASG